MTAYEPWHAIQITFPPLHNLSSNAQHVHPADNHSSAHSTTEVTQR